MSLLDEAADVQVPDDIGSQFTEMFIKDSENVGLLLSLLEVRVSSIMISS